MAFKNVFSDLASIYEGTILKQAAQKAHVSLPTALLWKRKIQRIPENAGNKVLSGDVWVDHTYINAPMSERRGRKKPGLSRQLLQVAVGIDSSGRVLIRLGTRGAAGTGDSRDAFLGHVAPDSTVYHDRGHFRGCFPGCREVTINSKDGEAHGLLSPVNRLCAQVKRRFAVHLRIHRKRAQLWLSEKAFRRENELGLSSAECMLFFYGKIFLTGKALRKREVYSR